MRAAYLLVLAVMLSVASPQARAYALLGQFDTWQTVDLGYNVGNLDPGGPMSIGEEYRWNVPEIFYAFDSSFLYYFGEKGAAAVQEAFDYLNTLPPASQMNLNTFPLQSRRFNTTALSLKILDLKSQTLGTMMTELGLAEPTRYIWTLRNRIVRTSNGQATTNYYVIRRNYDPETGIPTNVVNSILYTYEIQEFLNPNYSDAVEIPTDPHYSAYLPITSELNSSTWGEFFTGITRDDAGGLRHLYSPTRFAMESLPAGVTTNLTSFTNSAGGYTIYYPTNLITGNVTNFAFIVASTNATNVLIVTGLRPGVDRLHFTRTNYDSFLGQYFAPFTNVYSDVVKSNYTTVNQSVQRVVTQPDILFTAGDLGVYADTGAPVLLTRTVASAWTSNDALNGQVTQAGPGVIPPGVTQISFTTLLPYYLNSASAFTENLRENPQNSSGVWGSFNGSTNAPVVYPDYISLQQLEQMVLQGQGR